MPNVIQLTMKDIIPDGIPVHCEIVDRSNCERFNHFFYTIRNKDGKIKTVSWRRNGKTKLWKTRPFEFRIPIKWGMGLSKDNYMYIDNDTANLWWGSV